MVNTPISMPTNPYVAAKPELPWPPPQHGDEHEQSRIIERKIWDLSAVQGFAQQVLDGEQHVLKAITTDCVGDMQRLFIDAEYAAKLLLLLSEEDHYRNSRWCHTGATIPKRPDLGWVPCDAYLLPVDDEYENETVTKTYYIKLCLSPSGAMLLLISLHESN